MTCQVCRYHSGPPTDRQRLCPMIHTYTPPEPEAWEFPSSAWGNDSPDAKPLNRCPFCLDGTTDGFDPCVRCWGSNQGDTI